MKIAITANGKGLDSEIDPKFGRAQNFVIVDTETMEYTAHENSAVKERGGAGPVAVKTLSDMNVEVVITGNVGPNAFQALDASGIKAYIGASGTVKESIDKWKDGKLSHAGSPSVSSHTGMR